MTFCDCTSTEWLREAQIEICMNYTEWPGSCLKASTDINLLSRLRGNPRNVTNFIHFARRWALYMTKMVSFYKETLHPDNESLAP